MKLLKITDSQEKGWFQDDFEEVHQVSIEDVSPEVIKGAKEVRLNGKTVGEFDAAFLELPVKNAVFGRVLIEIIEEKGLQVNYPSTAFFVMSKKNYLYHVLHEKGMPAPTTVALATEKAARNIDRELEPPIIARRFENLEETENRLLYSIEEINEFAEGSEYEEDVLLFHEYREGDKYRCLVVNDRVISLKDDSSDWGFSQDGLKYSNIPDGQKQIVKKTARAIGAPVAEVLLRGNRIHDMNPNPDFELYTEVSGKNAVELVTEHLKGENV